MELIDFKLARKLKEKGFREKVNAYYGKHENIFDVHPALDMNDCDYRASAPTISQVLKWLREKKIYININTLPSFYKNFMSKQECRLMFDIRICYFKEEMYHYYDLNEPYFKYEDACIAGIEYIVEHLI